MAEKQKSLIQLLEMAPMPIYFTSVENLYCYVNRAWEKIARLNRDKAIGRSIDRIFPSETFRQLKEINNQVIASGLPLVIEEFVDTPDGRRFYHTVKFPLCRNHRKVELVGGVSVELSITAEAELSPRKNAEAGSGWDSAIARIAQMIASTLPIGKIISPLPPQIDGMTIPGLGTSRPVQNRNFDLLNLRSYVLSLTSREIQIANLIKLGKTSKEIAEILTISVRTVESHRENIRKKFGFNNKPTNLASFLAFLNQEIPSVVSPQ